MDNESINTIYSLLLISTFGATLNWTILYTIQHLKSFNHSFGLLTSNQLLADALHSTTFLCYFCPMVLLDLKMLKSYSQHCGFVLLFCYEMSVMTHLIISANRFYAVWAPYKYDKMFSMARTKMIIFGLWSFVGVTNVLFYEQFCWFYYDEQIKFLTFTNTEFCGYIGWYGDFLKNSAIVAIVMVVDLLTVFKVHKSSSKIGSTVSSAAQKRNAEREMRFLKQTVVQGSIFMLELLTYFFVPQYFQNQWIVFFDTSFAWVAVHALDGLVVILCNPRVRKSVVSCGSSSKSTSSTSVANVSNSNQTSVH